MMGVTSWKRYKFSFILYKQRKKLENQSGHYDDFKTIEEKNGLLDLKKIAILQCYLKKNENKRN